MAAADVDPVLWDMNSELIQLRRQLSELQRTLADRERQLAETRQGSEASERAVATLKGVLTDMVLKARTELQAAREEATRAMTERVAAAKADTEVLVADATAALTTVFGRAAGSDGRLAPDGAPTTYGVDRADDEPSSDPLPPLAARPWSTDSETGTALAAPPPAPPAAPAPASSPPPAPASDAGLPPWPVWPPPDPPPQPRLGDEFLALLRPEPEPAGRAPLNGYGGAHGSVLTLDPELDVLFEQVVGLAPNTEFKTPPRGTPAVSVPPVYDVTSTTVIGRAEGSPAPAPPMSATADSADSAFDEFWPSPGEAPTTPEAPPDPGQGQGEGRLRFSLIDALLPIVALTLIVIVVLSWLG